jgi:hypothetical protein
MSVAPQDPHPVQDRTKDELRVLADTIVRQLVKQSGA